MLSPIFLLCLLLPGVLLCIPAVLIVFWWLGSGKDAARPFPMAAVGAGLMALGFFSLPWLSIKPLERIGLDWLHDVAPFLGRLLALLGVDNLDRLLPIWRVMGIRPPGWLALVLNAESWSGLLGLGLGAVMLGGLIYALAHWIAVRRTPRYTAVALAIVATVLLLLLLYRLPDVDGLGEHDFRNIIPLILPVIFNIHLTWPGPLFMVAGLLLMLADALRHLYAPAGPDAEALAKAEEYS